MRVFLFAAFGGFAVNFLRLVEIAKLPKAQRPDTSSDWLYALQFFGMPIVGGALAIAYEKSGTALSPILALNIGASAPLILKTFASILPDIPPKRTD